MPQAEQRAKYTADQLKDLGAKGRAFKNDDGDWSYPIDDLEDLKSAIRAVDRGTSDDAIRKHIIGRAKSLDHRDLVPDNWNADGSLAAAASLNAGGEQRETANDVFSALSSIISDTYEGASGYESWWIWVQDWYGDGGETPWTVVFAVRDELYQQEFGWTDDNKVELVGDPVKVRQITSYVERDWRSPGGTVSRLAEWREKKAGELRGLERRTFPASEMELREQDDGLLRLSGYASVTETPYEVGFYTETIKRGAFKRTLGEDPDVQLLVNHEGLPLARTKSGTLRLTEDTRGLKVEADLDPQDPDVQSLAGKMRRGDVDQMSFAFQATDQDWNDDYTSRAINTVSIHRGDVSVVNQGANPAAAASIRSAEALQALRHAGAEGLIAALREYRAGKTLSAATMEVLTNVLNLVASADDAVDAAQPMLADLIGAPNPDTDSEDDEPEEEDALRSWAPLDHTTRARERLAQRRGRSR